MRMNVMMLVCGMAVGVGMGGAGVRAQGEPAPAAEVKVEVLDSPVQTCRVWTTAVSPKGDGAFTFIAQHFNYAYGKTGGPKPEWVVVEAPSGKQQSFELEGYANSNYSVGNQLRAPNGRIFFSCMGGNIHYFEPADGKMHTLGALFKGDSGYKFFYRLVIGADGNLYGTTQSDNGMAGLCVVDTQTLKWTFSAGVAGIKRGEGLTYGYYLAVDGPWVYIAVGQGEWRLAAVNTVTGEQKKIGPDGVWMSFEGRGAYPMVSIKVASAAGDPKTGSAGNVIYGEGTKSQRYWCVNGELVAAAPGAKLPERPATAGAAAGPALAQVEVGDPSREGVVRLKYRMAGAKPESAMETLDYTCGRSEPIRLESLFGLEDGRLLGNSVQYNGFFILDPNTGKSQWLGKSGPSKPVMTRADGLVYFAGYPNSGLWVYDPAKPWTGVSTKPEGNPGFIGYLGSAVSGAHYAYGLIPSSNGRVYFYGRLERGKTGSGVAYYDPKTKALAGHHSGLGFHKPRGLAVLDGPGMVVLSGELQDDENKTSPMPGEATLVFFDMDLKETGRAAVKPGLKHTGWLVKGDGPDEVVGCIANGKDSALYRYDAKARKLLEWVDLAEEPKGLFERASDGTCWMITSKNRLARLERKQLRLVEVGALSEELGHPVWMGKTLYGTQGEKVVRAQVGQ